MEFLEVRNTITKIKNLKDGFWGSLNKAEDLISKNLKLVFKKILIMGNKWIKICEKA